MEAAATPLADARRDFLCQLPLLLNSALTIDHILRVAMRELTKQLDAEAATIFLLDPGNQTLSFWASQGGSEDKLKGMKMPADKGVVGWVIAHQQSVKVDDASQDARFYAEVDKNSGFRTRTLVCVPLTVRGEKRLGALQVLNKKGGAFSDEDLVFLDQFSHHVALAVDNAQMVEDLREQNRKLEVLEKRKGEMMSVITHEFKTPLTLISSSADVISSGATLSAHTMSQMHSVLRRGLDRLNKLVSELRNLSLVAGSSAVAVSRSTVDLTALVEKVGAAFLPIASSRSLTLKTELVPLPAVQADEGLLTIVLNNMISNAIRFTADGGTVSIGTRSNPGVGVVFVSDTGIGIPAEELSLIFEKFYEVGSALNHSSGDFTFKSGGLGIGLATAKAILEAHGTTMEVTSTPGSGSTFAFALPVR